MTSIPEIYYCGIKKGKRFPFTPGSNYSNRFSGGLKNGVSTFIMSKERRKNVKIVEATPDQIVVEDNLISALLDAHKVYGGQPGVFIEFIRNNEIGKFVAGGIPFSDSGNSFLAATPFLWPFAKLPFELVLACIVCRANKQPSKTLEENMNKPNVFYDPARLKLKEILEGSLLWKTKINNLYIYSASPSEEIYSLYHFFLEKAKDPNWSEFKECFWRMNLEILCEKYYELYNRIHNYHVRDAKELDKFRAAVIGIKDNASEFYQLTVSHIDEILAKVGGADLPSPPPKSYYKETEWNNVTMEFFQYLSRTILQ